MSQSMESPAHKIAAAPAAQPALPDELLEEIFLRLDAPADLARASAACTGFRRVVTGRRFLRRFRSLHPPPVLGFLDPDRPVAFHPAESPHRSAPAARALARAADFTFSFLPAPNGWRVCDALDARVLLQRRRSDAAALPDLVVCDPLHRRYVQIPPIPDDLVVSTGARGVPILNYFLDPASKEKREDEDDVSFGVICAVQFQHKLVTFHLSSVTRKWHALTFDRELPLPIADMTSIYSEMIKKHYVHGCFYWMIAGGCFMFMQDMHEMRLCNIEIPTVTYRQQKAIVDVGEGRLGLLALHDGIFELYCKTLRDNCIGTEEWQHDRTIALSKLDSTWYWWIIGGDKRYVLLAATQYFNLIFRSSQQIRATQYFTLDLKTFLVERLSVSNNCKSAYLYASFPPPLSLPSI